MNKHLFNDLSNAVTMTFYAKQELARAEAKRDSLKRAFLQELVDEVQSGAPMKDLLYDYAVARNYGMDVEIACAEAWELVPHIRAYSKDVYCFNLDNIFLSDEDQEAWEEMEEEARVNHILENAPFY